MDRSRGSSGEPESPVFHSHPRGNFPKSEEVPRGRIPLNDGPGLLPNPDHGLLLCPIPSPNPSYPPGFDRNRSGFDSSRASFDNVHRNRSGFDNELMVQEPLEISSDRPSRRAPPSFDQDGKVLANEATKKRKKQGAEDAQRPSPAASDFDRTNKACHKLWKDLDVAIRQRERDLRNKEERFTPSGINKEVLEEEKRQTAAMKNDVMEERRNLDEEVQRVRKEKDALERTSTELAVQMVELKQVQRQLEKEKAALLAELSAKQMCSQEQDNITKDTPLVSVKPETEEPVTSLRTSAPHDIQNQEPEADIPVTSNKNLEPVKVELATSE